MKKTAKVLVTEQTAPETREPLCPECGSEKVGFSDIDELKCQCGHLFEPPAHMRGKGTPKNPHNKELDIAKRRKRDQFYWYLNDVLVEYSPGPRSFLQWREDYPNKTIQQWAEGEELALYFYVDKIKKGWRRYFRSLYPEETLKELSDLKYVLSLFKGDSPLALNEVLLERFGKALVKALPSRERPLLDLSKLPDWLPLDVVRVVIRQIIMKDWSKEKIRKLDLVTDPKRRGERSRESVFKYCEYTLPDPPEKD